MSLLISVYSFWYHWAAQRSRCACRPEAQPWGHHSGAQLKESLLSEPLSTALLGIQYTAMQDHDLESLWLDAF